jgi:tetratricopeptide (TPR) repeat protein
MMPELFTAVVGGVLIAVLTAAVGPNLWRNFRRRVSSRDQPPSEGALFTVLVADLSNDPEKSQTRHVIHALEDAFGPNASIEIRAFTRTLDVRPWGDQAAAVGESEARGREWLTSQNADLLVWGSVVMQDRTLRLRLLARDVSASKFANYPLTEIVTLPIDFGKDLSAMLSGLALSAAVPIIENPGKPLSQTLGPLLPKLRALVLSPPAAFDPLDRVRALVSFGLVATQIGDESGDRQLLAEARDALTSAAQLAANGHALLLGSINNNLGIASAELAKLTGSGADLENAAAAFQQAIDAWTDNPTGRWGVRVNLATVLAKQAERDSGVEGFPKVIELFSQALADSPDTLRPSEIASAKNGLANALLRVGQRARDGASLEMAEQTLVEALALLNESQQPQFWTATQANLGNVRVALADFEAVPLHKLQQAIENYRLSLAARSKTEAPLDWASSANGLATALARKAELLSDVTTLTEAIDLWRDVLSVRERHGALLTTGEVLTNLGTAYTSMGMLSAADRQRHGNEAIRFLMRARAMFQQLDSAHHLQTVEESIARARMLLEGQ